MADMSEVVRKWLLPVFLWQTMAQCQLSCVCIIGFICLYLGMVSGEDIEALKIERFSSLVRYNMKSNLCPDEMPFEASFTRPFYHTADSTVLKEIWGRILLYSQEEEAALPLHRKIDFIRHARNKYFHNATIDKLWATSPLPFETDREQVMWSSDDNRLQRYHRNYYKHFRDIELSRLQLVNCDKLWLHPASLQYYSVKFVADEAPFKVPCQVCTKKRYSSNLRNIFFKCDIRNFIEVDRGGESRSTCRPLYEHAWDMLLNKASFNKDFSIIEQTFGDQLYDGGGFYLHVLPRNEKAYRFGEDEVKNLLVLSSGIFYCKEGNEGEKPFYPDAEVIQLVDIVSFKKAKKYDTYKQFIHVPLNSTCGVPLNLQFHIIWQNAERCCSPREGDEQVKFGIVTVRKIDPTKTIFWDTTPITSDSELPIVEQFAGDIRGNLTLIDVGLSMPLFYDHGIRIWSVYGHDIYFGEIMTKLLNPPMPESGVLYDSQNCEQSDRDKYADCLKDSVPKRRPQYFEKEKKKKKDKIRTRISSTSDIDSSCIPCTIPRNMHRVIESKGNLQVEFRLHQHIIVSCVDPGKTLPNLQSITWQKDKGHVIKQCRGLNKTFVINGELHVHAATLEDVGTYICKVKGKQSKTARLSLASGKWISDFWFYFCIIVPGTLLILGLLIWCQIIPDCCLKSTGVGLVAQMALDYGRDVMQMKKEEKDAQGLEKTKLYVARQLARNRRVHA